MGEPDYAYAVANIRANEYRLLTKSDLRGFLSASSASDIIRVLKERGFGFPASDKTDDDMIKSQNVKIFSYLHELAGENKIFDSFLMRNDFHNLKAMIKAKISGTPFCELILSPSLIDSDTIKTCINRSEFSALPAWIRETAETALITGVETRDGQLCDMIIDKSMMDEIKKTSIESKNAFMVGFVEKQIVLFDILIALRACKAKKNKSTILYALTNCDTLDIHELASAAAAPDSLASFLSEKGFPEAAETLTKGVIAAFERVADNQIIAYADTVKYNIFGIEPLIAYLIYNEMEQKNLRIILAGKRAGVPENEIRERMRESYA